jgi:catechol 2,3-dioxygenase-like lactoylglutathione lyase family enzyme
MRLQTFADGRVALHFGRPGMEQKINLHEAGNEFEPKAQRPTTGSADLCLVSAVPLAEAMAHVRECGVAIIEGPVPRTGAAGPMSSFYFHDPDGNLIEICHY